MMRSGENLTITIDKTPTIELEIIDNYFFSDPKAITSDLPSSSLNEVKEDSYHLSSPLLSEPRAETSEPKKISKAWRWLQKTRGFLQIAGNKLLNLLRHYASWVSFLQTLTSALLERIPALVLRITDYISPVGRIINGLKLLYNTIYHRKDVWTRRFSLIASLGSVGLGIAAILLPPFGLIFATANIASNTFLSLWAVTVSIRNKLILRSAWKDYDLEWITTLPPQGPLPHKVYIGFKNNALCYQVNPLKKESKLTLTELSHY
jgi:hypothetical protein